jgi:hypothetical protein
MRRVWDEPDRRDVARRVARCENLPAEIWSLELAGICPQGTTLSPGLRTPALPFSDGPLAFMPSDFLGDDPHAPRWGLRKKLRAMLEENYDALLITHSEPLLNDGHHLLNELLAE